MQGPVEGSGSRPIKAARRRLAEQTAGACRLGLQLWSAPVQRFHRTPPIGSVCPGPTELRLHSSFLPVADQARFGTQISRDKQGCTRMQRAASPPAEAARCIRVHPCLSLLICVPNLADVQTALALIGVMTPDTRYCHCCLALAAIADNRPGPRPVSHH